MDQGKMVRLLRVVMLLVNNRCSTVQELGQELGVSCKTVYRYIDSLREAGLMVEKEENNVYRVRKLSKRFQEISELIYFTKEEAYILKSAIEGIDENNAIKQNLKKKLYSIYDFKMVADIVVHPQNRDNVHHLITAIESGKQVVLHDYRSAHSNSVSTRVVEPFALTANYVQAWCYELSEQKVKCFKISRIGSVEVTDVDWQFRSEHKQGFMDVFRMQGKKQMPVKLRLSVRAANLLLEEYPLSKDYLTRINENSWRFEAKVCGFDGVARFILGLYDDVEIEESVQLKEFIARKIKRMAGH